MTGVPGEREGLVSQVPAEWATRASRRVFLVLWVEGERVRGIGTVLSQPGSGSVVLVKG